MKNTEIDWSKAPEGATHWEPANGAVLASWMMLSKGAWYFWPPQSEADGRIPRWVKSVELRPTRTAKLVPRPTPQWNGEGLPPVGVDCEAHCGEWCYATCVAHHDGGAVMAMHECDLSYSYVWCSAHGVRPVRTPEQLAAEARESAVNGMLCHATLGGTRRGLAEALYDAGYRKTTES